MCNNNEVAMEAAFDDIRKEFDVKLDEIRRRRKDVDSSLDGLVASAIERVNRRIDLMGESSVKLIRHHATRVSSEAHAALEEVSKRLDEKTHSVENYANEQLTDLRFRIERLEAKVL